MKCRLKNADEVAEKYLLNELCDKERVSFEEHLLACDQCYAKVDRLRQFINHVKLRKSAVLAGSEAPPTFFSVFNRHRVWGLAASVIVVLLAVFVLTRSPGLFESGKPDRSAQYLAASFEPSPQLEYLVGQELRDGDTIQILGPENGAEMQDSLVFAWTPATDGPELVVLSNKNEKLYEFTVNGTFFTFSRMDHKLDPGLYYWKLQNKDGLVHLGKFFVRD